MTDTAYEQRIQEALTATKDEIADAARAAGRDPKEVTLIAVSKVHPAQAIVAAAKTGHRAFGENYIQEALAKQEELADLDIDWHFIGKIQSNKAKFIPGRFAMLHTIDKPKLAHALHKRLTTACAPQQDVLIEVNLGREGQKAGVDVSELPQLVEELAELPSMRLRGLMIIPPFDLTPDQRRPLFAKLRELRDGLETRTGQDLPHLSMGMTDDFTQAVKEGATIVRVGTKIFGVRPPRNT